MIRDLAVTGWPVYESKRLLGNHYHCACTEKLKADYSLMLMNILECLTCLKSLKRKSGLGPCDE